MSDTLEQTLRRAMVALGHVVERMIGTVKHAKVQVESRGGVQPVLSLESLLAPARIADLIEWSIQRVMKDALPDLSGLTALEIGEGPARYLPHLLASKAQTAVGVEIGGAVSEKQGDASRGYVLRAQPSRLPFPNNRFGYAIARLATPQQGDVVRVVHELGRVLAPGGQGVLIDYHPFGPYAKRGTGRLRSAESGLRRFEDYYRLAKKVDLRVVDLREAIVDEEMRSFFEQPEIGIYRALKGSPLITFFFLYKPKQR
jgi:SAM-dependent methyltransferase